MRSIQCLVTTCVLLSPGVGHPDSGYPAPVGPYNGVEPPWLLDAPATFTTAPGHSTLTTTGAANVPTWPAVERQNRAANGESVTLVSHPLAGSDRPTPVNTAWPEPQVQKLLLHLSDSDPTNSGFHPPLPAPPTNLGYGYPYGYTPDYPGRGPAPPHNIDCSPGAGRSGDPAWSTRYALESVPLDPPRALPAAPRRASYATPGVQPAAASQTFLFRPWNEQEALPRLIGSPPEALAKDWEPSRHGMDRPYGAAGNLVATSGRQQGSFGGRAQVSGWSDPPGYAAATAPFTPDNR
jgi:hypothetical protein